MTLWSGWPEGEPLTRRARFVGDPPQVGEVTETFSGQQWRITEITSWKDKHEVTEVKLAPSEHVDEPEWVMKSPRDP